MTFRLVDSGWPDEIASALRADASELRIICPFIKIAALERLLSKSQKRVQVITRFNLNDFADGVSDLSALRHLLQIGAKVRGIKNLHAKLYLFGSGRAIVTSANLTEAAMNRNHELGIVSEDKAVIGPCQSYFDDLWKCGSADLLETQIDEWTQKVAKFQAGIGKGNSSSGLGDFGADGGIPKPPPFLGPSAVANASQAFVKFLGEGDKRVPLSHPTIEIIDSSLCHWAVAYPATKRPRAVKDGAIIFIGRFTYDPHDIRIFGRAIGMRHVPGRDDASSEDIKCREWKATWSRYIRVHQPELLAGTLENAVSLNKLMDALGPKSFEPTKRHAAKGIGNTDPRKAYQQQAAVELSNEGLWWLNERLQKAFDAHGKVPQATLDTFDGPTFS